MRHARAFTLIELLVVIAVIMILAAMVMPVINLAIESAHKTSCLNNVHQIYATIMQYASRWDGMYPAMDQSNYVISSGTCWNIPNQCYNFPFLAELRALGTKVVYCPSEPYSEWHIRINHPWAIQWGMGYNIWGGRSWPWYREHVTPLIAGTTPANSLPTQLLISDIVRTYCGLWLRDGDYMNNHYRSDTYATTGGHACFVDGHIRWTSAEKLNWDIRYNNANLYNTMYDYGWHFCAGFQP
jgi:prepilin-type N-terminal cleavage/methylation domain-containing protein